MRIKVAGVRLHVTVMGDEWRNGTHAPVLLALHGGPGFDGGVLRVTAAPASTYAQVVVPDQRGHGHSDASGPADWTLDRWADDVAGLVDALGLERPVLLGTSFGGFVVQRYLARHPEQPAGAVLVSTCASAPVERDIIELFRMFGGDAAADAMQALMEGSTSDAVFAAWKRLCAPLLHRRPPTGAILEAEKQRIRSPAVADHFAAVLPTLELRPGLAAVRCPVLVLAGELDPLTPPRTAAELVDALPPGLGEAHFLPDASHQVLADQPEASHALIEDFVRRVTKAG